MVYMQKTQKLNVFRCALNHTHIVQYYLPNFRLMREHRENSSLIRDDMVVVSLGGLSYM